MNLIQTEEVFFVGFFFVLFFQKILIITAIKKKERKSFDTSNAIIICACKFFVM